MFYPYLVVANWVKLTIQQVGRHRQLMFAIRGYPKFTFLFTTNASDHSQASHAVNAKVNATLLCKLRLNLIMTIIATAYFICGADVGNQSLISLLTSR